MSRWYNKIKGLEITMATDISRFIKVYANLPVNLRNEVVLVLKDEQGQKQLFTWNVAYLEISNKTKLGEKIFNKLVELDII